MATLTVTVPDDLVAQLDAWAQPLGGRSQALRRLIQQTVGVVSPTVSVRRAARTSHITVRITAEDGRRLVDEAAEAGLTRNAWAHAVLRRRLLARPTFRRSDELDLIAIQSELRRIRLNVNEIARALRAAPQGQAPPAGLAHLDAFQTEIRAHIVALGAAFKGNLEYWQGGS